MGVVILHKLAYISVSRDLTRGLCSPPLSCRVVFMLGVLTLIVTMGSNPTQFPSCLGCAHDCDDH